MTNRRALISDPKYQHFSINVDDDYHDVWNQKKQYGQINFVGKENGPFNKTYNESNNSFNNGNFNPPLVHRSQNSKPLIVIL